MQSAAPRCVRASIGITNRIAPNKARKTSRVLEINGLITAEAQAKALGNVMTPRRLGCMALGGNVSTFTARAIEHMMRLPRGWLDKPQPLDAGFPACFATVSAEHPSSFTRLVGHAISIGLLACSDLVTWGYA